MITCQMRCRGVNSLGWFNRSPQQGPSLIQLLVTIFVRCDDGGARVYASALCLLEMNSERAAVERGALTMSSLSLCQQVKGWARRHHESQVQSHQEGKKARFPVLLGTLVDNEGQPIHEVSPVTQKQSMHKSASVRSDYLRGSGPGLGVCSLLSQVWICSLKRKIKAGREMSEQKHGGSEGGQAFLNLLKPPLSNVLFSVIGWGQGVGVGQSLFIFQIFVTVVKE